jgi:type II secretory pathway pseudopilin PulG
MLHIWTAAIVAGLVVVITGAVAFSSTQAEGIKPVPTPVAAPVAVSATASAEQVQKLNDRMEALNNKLDLYLTQCKPTLPAAKNADECRAKCKAVATTDAAMAKCLTTLCGLEAKPTPKPETPKPAPAPLSACAQGCANAEKSCKTDANGNIELRQKCERTRESCVKACAK